MSEEKTHDQWVIWSEEHGGWWAPGGYGYTRSLRAAGRYSKEEACSICLRANEYLESGTWNEVCLPDPLARFRDMARDHAALCARAADALSHYALLNSGEKELIAELRKAAE
jgi:hypothetical protein